MIDIHFSGERERCWKLNKVSLIKLREKPVLENKTAWWFSQKWDIPFEDYRDSIAQCIKQKTSVPQWYVMLNENQDIIAGAGVIENDFNDRKDLAPNLCALFVEKPYRNHGIARKILDFVRKDMYGLGIKKLYLVTEHTEFYERCGWSFLTIVRDVEGHKMRMYMADTGEIEPQRNISY